MNFQNLIIVWVLIFTRVSSCFIFLPILSSRNIPMKIKIIFISMLSFAFLVSGVFNYNPIILSDDIILKSIIFEFINGMTIGFASMLIMNSIYVAGLLIDMNMGFSMVNVMSAQDEASLPVTANMYYIFMLIIFIITNSHHAIIDAFALSLNNLELGTLGYNFMHTRAFTQLMSQTFTIGFRIAIPIVLTILVSNVILGLLSKAMPGMNVFMIGMPFKILVGLATIMIVLPSTYKLFIEMLEILMNFTYGIVGAIN